MSNLLANVVNGTLELFPKLFLAAASIFGGEPQEEATTVVENPPQQEVIAEFSFSRLLSEEEMHLEADRLAGEAYGINPKMLTAFRQIESHRGAGLHEGLYGDTSPRWSGGGSCSNGMGYTNVVNGNYHAVSQYQIDIYAHCAWYRANSHLIDDLSSPDQGVKQAAINAFAMKSAELIAEKQRGVASLVDGSLLTKATACAYNQGVGGVTRDLRNGWGLCASSTGNYGDKFMAAYNSL